MISGLLREISFIAITWTQRQTVHAESSFSSYSDEVHRRYQTNTYNTVRIVGKQIDYWNVDGERIV